MLLLTHSYLVPREKEDQHARIAKRLQEAIAGFGGELEVFEQLPAGFERPVGTEAAPLRFVQISRFRDARHLAQVQAAERADTYAQALIAEFCELIDLAGQQARGSYVPGHYSSLR